MIALEFKNLIKATLTKQFEMKDLCILSYFLGLEITSSSNGYFLSQAKYALYLFARATLTNNKIVDTHVEGKEKLGIFDGDLLDATLY